MLETLLELDRELFFFLNGINNSFFDIIMTYISKRLTWVPLYAFLLYLMIREYKWKTLWLVLFVILLITLSDQGSGWFKDFFERLRPSRDPSIMDMIHLPAGRRGGSYGFVSAHAANTFALAGFVTLLFKGKNFLYLRIIFFTYASLNAYSRIYLGVHYPGDVIGGTILGLIIAWAVGYLWCKLQEKLPVPASGFLVKKE